VSFLFQSVKAVTKIISLAMIWMLKFSKWSGSATSSQTPFMASFMQKKRQNQLKKPKKQILVALLWQFFAIKFALKQGHK
jgi:hypothetical protein